MATPLATAFVRIRPDTTTFKRDTETAIGRAKLSDSGKRAGTHFMTGFRGAVAGIGGVLAAAFAVKAGFDMFSGFIADARESQRVARITAATIKATGGAANVTAGQVQALANKQMLLTGVDDEVIRSGENMLLTFRNVRNEVGKGNDIFNRASTDLLDMASALHGGDVSSESLRKTAIQLGKALNDPVLGLQSMRRMGVSFTKEQQKMIAGWVEHGHLVRAQKFILKELEREFGGTAKAASDPMQRLRTMFKEVGESIGTWLLGPLTKVVDYITNTAMPAISDWWKKAAGPKVSAAWKALTQGKTTTTPLAAQGGARPGDVGKPQQAPAWQKFLVTLRQVAIEVAQKLWPALQNVFHFVSQVWGVLVQVGKAMLPAWRDVWTFVKQLWGAVQTLWTAFKPIVGPVLKLAIGLIVLAFKGLAWLLAHVVGPGIEALATAVKNVSGWIRTAWKALTDWIGRTWSSAWNTAKGIFRGFVNFILGLFGSIVHGAATAFGWIPGLGGKLKAADKAFQNFRDRVNAALGGINGRTIDVGVKFSLGVPGHRVAAKGLYVNTGTGPTADDVLIAASKGELVVPANMVKAGAVDHLRGQIPGFASGGPVGVNVRPQVPPESTIWSKVGRAVYDMAKQWAKGAAAGLAGIGAGTGSQIARFALGYRGVPYVWGGTSPITGWDCSGATSYWYKHFGYPIPRTSQQQQLWARPSPPVAGALAFYYGTGGRASHVGLSLGNGQIINAYGTGYGTIISPLRMSGYSGAGIPPGGFVSPSKAGTLGQGKISAISRLFGGGLITEPVAGVGLLSGRGYALGERGVERVTPGAGPAGDWGPLLARLDRLIAAAERGPARTANGLHEALTRAGRRAAYGGMYGG